MFSDVPAPLRGILHPRLHPPPRHLTVPCWHGRTAWLSHVKIAYTRRYKDIRTYLSGGVSLDAVVRVAEAMSSFADASTGRGCRPTNRRLVSMSRCGLRTVQRARRVLELLGVAVRVVDGRVRTRAERIASWLCGDRSRGWAAEYVLSTPRWLAVIPHAVDKGTPPRREKEPRKSSGSSHTTVSGFDFIDKNGQTLLTEWSRHGACPAWTRRDRGGVTRALGEAHARGWTWRDLDTAVAAHESRTGLQARPGCPGAWIRWLVRGHDSPPHQARMARARAERARLVSEQVERSRAIEMVKSRRAEPGYGTKLLESAKLNRSVEKSMP